MEEKKIEQALEQEQEAERDGKLIVCDWCREPSNPDELEVSVDQAVVCAEDAQRAEFEPEDENLQGGNTGS